MTLTWSFQNLSSLEFLRWSKWSVTRNQFEVITFKSSLGLSFHPLHDNVYYQYSKIKSHFLNAGISLDNAIAVIRSHKDGQCNDQTKKDKQWSTKHYTENLSNTNPTKNRVNTGAPDVHAPLVAPVVLLLNDTE